MFADMEIGEQAFGHFFILQSRSRGVAKGERAPRLTPFYDTNRTKQKTAIYLVGLLPVLEMFSTIQNYLKHLLKHLFGGGR